MRVIELKNRKNGNGRPDVPLTDQQLLLECAYNAPQGANFAAVDQACKLADKIRLDPSRLQLEDADWSFLCEKFQGMPWNTAVVDPEIVRELGTALMGAPQVELPKVDPPPLPPLPLPNAAGLT